MTSAGKRKPRKARASVMKDALGRVAAGAPLLPAHGPPLNATDPMRPSRLQQRSHHHELLRMSHTDFLPTGSRIHGKCFSRPGVWIRTALGLVSLDRSKFIVNKV